MARAQAPSRHRSRGRSLVEQGTGEVLISFAAEHEFESWSFPTQHIGVEPLLGGISGKDGNLYSLNLKIGIP
jgi:hypothetical protein